MEAMVSETSTATTAASAEPAAAAAGAATVLSLPEGASMMIEDLPQKLYGATFPHKWKGREPLRGRLAVHARALRVDMHWQSLVRWHRSWHVPEQVLNRDGPPFFSLNAHRFFWVSNFLFIECLSSSAF